MHIVSQCATTTTCIYPVCLLMMSDKAIVYRVCAVYGNRWWEWFCGIMSVRGLGERASQPLLLWWELCCASENHISCMSMRMWKRRQPAKQSILFAYSDVMSHFFLVIYVNPFFSYRCQFFLLRFSVHCVSVFLCFLLLLLIAMSTKECVYVRIVYHLIEAHEWKKWKFSQSYDDTIVLRSWEMNFR